MPPAPCKMTFDLLTLKVVSESRMTLATSVPILVFLGLSVLDLGPMYETDRQTDRCLMPPTQVVGHNNDAYMHIYTQTIALYIQIKWREHCCP